MRYINDTLRNELSQDFHPNERDFSNAEPVSDEVFRVIKDLFRYEKEDLKLSSNRELKLKIGSGRQFWEEPYEDTPMELAVFLPTNAKAPFQSVLYYPGVNARDESSSAGMILENTGIDFYLKGGRAFIWPAYYSTYGRGEIEADNMKLAAGLFLHNDRCPDCLRLY